MSFSIIIATHGDESWHKLAWERAWPSAKNQGAEVLIDHVPDATRAQVRNRLIKEASGDWIITLDADDELAPGYVTALERAFKEWAKHKTMYVGKVMPLLTPQVSYVRPGKLEPEKFWPEVDLADGNWMVVGTAAPRALMLEVGGWRTFTGSGVLNEWDDWDMWIRCVQAGAGIVKVPDAVYVAHVRNSPHHSRTRAMTQAWLKEIREANGIGG